MIKLERPNTPQILIDNQKNWTDNLLALVTKYGSYKKIPNAEKDAATHHYRHPEIKKILFPSSYKKCAFCEGFPEDSGNIEVEHFHPKSIYYEETFEWNNFLPCCRKCNGAKDDHDTKAEPIVNPYQDDPNDYFGINNLRLTPKNVIAEKTIEVCALKGTRLYRPYSELWIQLHQFEDNLKNALDDLAHKNTPTTRKNKLYKINEAIDTLENLMDKTSRYSFFCTCFITASEVYQLAKKLLNEEYEKVS